MNSIETDCTGQSCRFSCIFLGYYNLKKGNFLLIQISSKKKKLNWHFSHLFGSEENEQQNSRLATQGGIPLCLLRFLVSTKVMLCCWKGCLETILRYVAPHLHFCSLPLLGPWPSGRDFSCTQQEHPLNVKWICAEIVSPSHLFDFLWHLRAVNMLTDLGVIGVGLK